MAKKMILAIFDSRSKAEEAVSRLSQLGLTDVFMKTSRFLPDFSPTGVGSLSFFYSDDNEMEFTTVTGKMPDANAAEASRIIKKFGGLT